MNVSFRSQNWRERILSNFADTPFSITLHGETFQCRSVEGFWQGLKSEGDRRNHIFQLSGLAAKKAGRGKRSDSFELAGQTVRVGSREHEELIREAIRQKILQTPRAAEALKNSIGDITHHVSGRNRPVFKMEQMLQSIRNELYGH